MKMNNKIILAIMMFGVFSQNCFAIDGSFSFEMKISSYDFSKISLITVPFILAASYAVKVHKHHVDNEEQAALFIQDLNKQEFLEFDREYRPENTANRLKALLGHSAFAVGSLPFIYSYIPFALSPLIGTSYLVDLYQIECIETENTQKLKRAMMLIEKGRDFNN